MKLRGLTGLAALACALAIQTAHAGDARAMRHFADEDLAAIPVPATDFAETEVIAADYDKYFYFQRDDTSFDEAYADLIECDALTSGISYYGGGSINPGAFAQYGVMPSAIGSAIGSAIADAVFGSAERRRIRRVNMRNCMGFKGYNRFGLEKGLWQQFNFEEGFSREEADSRELALKKQARRASAARPQTKVLDL